MELVIPEIETLILKIDELTNKVNQQSPKVIPEWLNDEQCWNLKGGMALTTYRNNRYYQVKGGIPDGYVGGRKVWNRESVLEWLPLTDDQLQLYHQKYKTGATKK